LTGVTVFGMMNENRRVPIAGGAGTTASDGTPSSRGRGTAGGEKMAVHHETSGRDERTPGTANPMLGIYRGVQISMLFWGGLAAVLLVIW